MTNSTTSPHEGGKLNMSPRSAVSKQGFQALIWTCACVAIAFTVMRGSIRIKLAGRLMMDDYAVLASSVLFVALCACYQAGLSDMWNFDPAGNGLTTSQVDSSRSFEVWQKYQFAVYLLFWGSLWAVKASFLLFFRRLLIGAITRSMVWWNLVTGFTVAVFFTCVGLLCGSCVPLSTYFKTRQCRSPMRDMDIFVLWFAASADVVTDLMIMILPWQLLWGLQVNLKQKFALACVFSLSAVIVLFSILRVTHTTPGTGQYGPISVGFWTMLEGVVAVIVACLPSLKFLVTSRRHSRSGYPKRGYADTFMSESRYGRPRGQEMRLGHVRGLGSVASASRASRALVRSDSEENIMPDAGIYIIKDVKVTESLHALPHSDRADVSPKDATKASHMFIP